VARPSKYKAAMCDQVIELGHKGYSKAQIAREFDVSRTTLDSWASVHPEFLNALKKAKDMALAHWEDIGRSGMGMGKDFNATVWIFSMKNRFAEDYRDLVDKSLTLNASDAFVRMLQGLPSVKLLEHKP
jgi:hypothetical protein